MNDKLKIILGDRAPELEAICQRIFGEHVSDVLGCSKDRGERIALLHAIARAEQGERVILLCDDGPACAMMRTHACIHATRVIQKKCPGGGSIQVQGTVSDLGLAVEHGLFSERSELRQVYERMAALDDALDKDIHNTGLLDSPPWS